MSFQAVIGQAKLKSLTQSLTCLSRYSDDIVIRASPEALFLIAISSSNTAFARVKFTSEFFRIYKVNPPTLFGSTSQPPSHLEDHGTVTGQLLVKALLSILKHKTVDKTVDRCELSIVERDQDIHHASDNEVESLESKLIIRLYCKHGVVKTHRLLLSLTDLQGPQLVASPMQSHVTIGPRALKDILDHFPHTKGTKSDPELVWLFGIDDIKVKSMQLGGDARGKSLISTEILMSAEEFDSYDIYEPPLSLGFHLREFTATIALAESLSVALDMQFTEHASPLYIKFNTDAFDAEFFFVISTTQSLYDSLSPSKRPKPINLRKRGREGGQNAENAGDGESAMWSTRKRPLRQASPPEGGACSQNADLRNAPSHGDLPSATGARDQLGDQEPLFLQGASQLSNADLEVLRSSGLGTEHMDFEEFEAMMAADGEEVGMSTAVENVKEDNEGSRGQQEWELGMDRDQHMWPSQVPVTEGVDKAFRPLFDD
ncbi:Rad9-domain-containing protein [Gautieria morchelliformis]|nr:Rad9-domain-containing protein [Gautieria morchelliformis]